MNNYTFSDFTRINKTLDSIQLFITKVNKGKEN